MNLQDRIITALGVSRKPFFAGEEITTRTKFLEEYLQKTGCRSYVLGISGGIDSTVAGCLAQLAVDRFGVKNKGVKFIAVRLPYGEQHDEEDARRALDYIGPDQLITVNIRPAVDEMVSSLVEGGVIFDENTWHYHIGNIKARQRMVVQYAIAAANKGLVVGTDHAAEAVMGFFTKFGDGAADVVPLDGLNKRRVRAIGTYLGLPSALVNKVPTADLESDRPGKPDEEAYGVTYDEIDDYLEGRPVSKEAREKIEAAYERTRHKRELPVAP